MMPPTFRCASQIAINELAIELNLPNSPHMQDWSYEVADPDQIEMYITHYNQTTDEDKRFVLMEMILQALIDQSTEEQLLHYWEKVQPLLVKDFAIHAFTIHYWKSMTDVNFENCKTLSPLLEQLWRKQDTKD